MCMCEINRGVLTEEASVERQNEDISSNRIRAKGEASKQGMEAVIRESGVQLRAIARRLSENPRRVLQGVGVFLSVLFLVAFLLKYFI